MSKIKVNNILALPNTNLLIWTPGKPAASPPTEPAPRIVVTVAGKVGIGTQAPYADLSLETENTDQTDLRIVNTSTGDPQISWFIGTPGENTDRNFSLGIDNSDSDKLKLGTTSVSTNTAITVTSTPSVEIAQTAWQAITAYGTGNSYDFTHYWTNYGSTWAVASYMKDSQGFVHIKGLVKTTDDSAGTLIFTLPSGFRPADSKDHIFACFGRDSGASDPLEWVLVRIAVRSTGRVQVGEVSSGAGFPNENDEVSLSNITFYAGF